MAILMKIPALLAAFLLVTAAQYTGVSSTPPSSACEQAFSDCNYHAIRFVLRGFPNRIDIDATCSHDQILRRCFNGNNGCLDAATDEPLSLQVYNYVCDPSRRDQMKAVSNLSCLQNPHVLGRRMEADFQACVLSSMTPTLREQFDYERVINGMEPETTGQLCPIVSSVISCLLVKTEDFCGPEMVPLVNDIIEITGDFFTGVMITGCNRHTGIVSDHSSSP